MRKVNLSEINEVERKSPKGNFHKFVKDISVALGRDKDSLDLAKRHPFDLAVVRIPKGKTYCPYHAHSAETELYLVISGRGRVRDRNGSTEVSAGAAFVFAPGEAHQLANAGEEDFVYYVIADNPRGDSCYYPDSRKFAVAKEGSEEVITKADEADYFEGEE
ncbi:MAG: cupin domain-containing protein [Chthoniobacterales bacterium]|nr:cupin domain-containing protein [Chthoniobacterales bacterium]